MGCGSRFRTELSTSYFDENDGKGNVLDLDRSFHTNPSKPYLLLKLILWGLTISTMVYGWATSLHPGFYMAYLTRWALTFAIIYMTLSLVVGLRSSRTLVNMAWIWFSCAICFEAGVVLLYWLLEYDSELYNLDYKNFMEHAGVFLIILVDGMIVNRVPIRLKHVTLTLFFVVMYIIWTVIHAFVVEYNPYDDDDDDALYDTLKWKKSVGDSIVFCLIVLLGLMPMLHLFFWSSSLCGRRYKPEKETSQSQYDEEVGTGVQVH